MWMHGTHRLDRRLRGVVRSPINGLHTEGGPFAYIRTELAQKFLVSVDINTDADPSVR